MKNSHNSPGLLFFELLTTRDGAIEGTPPPTDRILEYPCPVPLGPTVDGPEDQNTKNVWSGPLLLVTEILRRGRQGSETVVP